MATGSSATDVIPGKPTNVTYKCNDPFVLDPNRPQFSTCDQLTGQWTDLPKCICADPLVPANAQIASYADFNVTYKCGDPFVLNQNGPQLTTCDQLTGQWTGPSICVCADPPVPANGQIVSRTDFSVQFQCDFSFLLKGIDTVVCGDTGTWDQLPSCKH